MSVRIDIFAVATCALLLTPAAASAADAVPDYVTNSLDYLGRTPWDTGRDAARKPAQILAFAQVKPGMKVVDLVPGDTYYTRILARLVGPKGHVYAVVPGGGGAGARGARQAQRAGLPPSIVPAEKVQQCVQGCYPDSPPAHMLSIDWALALENITEFRDTVTALWEDLGAYGGDLALPEQVDAVLSVDGYHTLHFTKVPDLKEGVPGRNNTVKPPDMTGVSKSILEDLNPGGVYTVVDFAAAPGRGFADAQTLYRVEPAAVKQEILSAGFVLDGESDVLANPADDPTRPAGGTIASRDRTDQFVLRFKKPVTASGATKRPSPAREAVIMHNYYGNTHILNADLKQLDTSNGNRMRYHYYNADHTYQEMGRVDEGPGPLQEGVWFWDANGYNCMLHEFPVDERGNVVCHDYVIDRPLNVMTTQETGQRKGTKFMIVPGHVRVP